MDKKRFFILYTSEMPLVHHVYMPLFSAKTNHRDVFFQSKSSYIMLQIDRNALTFTTNIRYHLSGTSFVHEIAKQLDWDVIP